ncbi:hypothetical protein PVT71_12375 [Salipiger sp. H15]|uniref:Phage terminase small subunit P27 family n=1 Tax=Alloyangia sp. H15 TaxID=3029062 RepID=A0AAU8AEC9_9RHOB
MSLISAQSRGIDPDDRRWPPLPGGYEHSDLDDVTWRLYRELAQTVDLARGVLPTDLAICLGAAQAFVEAKQWRDQIAALRVLETSPGENVLPLQRASRSARECMNSYQSALTCLGLRGSEFGATRAKKVRAAAGFSPEHGSKWEGVGLV